MTKRTSSSLVTMICLLGFALLCGAAFAAEFSDVPKWHWAWCAVQGVSDAQVAGGYEEGYHPDWDVTRDQMTVFIARVMCGGEDAVPDSQCTEDPFPDVPCEFWARKHIAYCVDEGVVSGYEDGYFRPDEVVTRDQMAAFLARAMCGGEDQVPDPACTEPPFPDVPCDFWARKHIQYILSQGVTQGYPDGKFHPEYACCRDQMAVFMCRAWDLPMPPQPYNITEYWPLVEGNTWNFKTESGTYTDAVSGTEIIDEEEYVCLRFPDGSVNYWQVAEHGLRHGGWEDPEYGRVTYATPPHFPNGLDLGEVVSGSTAAYLDGTEHGDITWSLELLAVEGVTVPAGTFSDCLKAEVHMVSLDEEQHFYQWFAKGVGPVRRDETPLGGDEWEELVAATIGGVRYPAEGWDITDYFPLGEGDCWAYKNNSSVNTDIVSGTEDVWGETYVRLVHNDGSFGYLQAAPDGLRMAGYCGHDGEATTYDPPLYLPNGMYPGDRFVQTSTVYLDDIEHGEVTFTSEFLGLENVTVPAATFPDCMKIEWKAEAQGEEQEHWYLWLAEGLGHVKEDARPFGGWHWNELASARVGDTFYKGLAVDVDTGYWQGGQYTLCIDAGGVVGEVFSIDISGPAYLATATVVKPGAGGGTDPTVLYDDGLHYDFGPNDGFWSVHLQLAPGATPQVGDTISFHITFADISSDTKQKTITTVYSQTPTLTSPADGSTVASLTPTLQWIDAPIAGLTYHIEVDDVSHNRFFTSPAIPEGTESYTLPAAHLQSATTYLWLVHGSDLDGNMVLAGWNTFTTP